jgi:nitrogenase molybdenum-iron protein beta chain
VQEFAKVDTATANNFIETQERSFYYFFERAADFFMEFRWDMPGHFVTIADSYYGIGISRLLTNQLGLLPLHQFVTDDPPEEFHPSILEGYDKIAPGISSGVTLTSDCDRVNQTLREFASTPSIILGSVWDRDIAQELSGCHLSISSPMTDRLVTSCSYLGYNGGLRLMEDLYSSILSFVH